MSLACHLRALLKRLCIFARSSLSREELHPHLRQALKKALQPAPKARPAPSSARVAPSHARQVKVETVVIGDEPEGEAMETEPEPEATLESAEPAEPAEPCAEPLVPCLLLRGMPKSWGEEKFNIIFIPYGGMSKLQLTCDAEGPLARVQLHKAENMAKVVAAFNDSEAPFYAAKAC